MWWRNWRWRDGDIDNKERNLGRNGEKNRINNDNKIWDGEIGKEGIEIKWSELEDDKKGNKNFRGKDGR